LLTPTAQKARNQLVLANVQADDRIDAVPCSRQDLV
jgi:hypothetical protein